MYQRVIGWLLLAVPVISAAAISVTDDTGRTLHLTQPAQRIITLSPHATELVFAAGAGGKLVAVAAYSDHPSAAVNLPTIGGAGALDREQLLLLQPDLVVAWDSGNRQADLNWLNAKQIQVFRSEPTALEDIAETIEKLGRLADTSAAASINARTFRQGLQLACPKANSTPAMQSYFEIWPHPAMTIGSQHWLNEILRNAGLENSFSDIDKQVVIVGKEAILSRPVAVYISNFSAGAIDHISPVKTELSLTRPGPRIIEGIRALCTQIQGPLHGADTEY